MPKDAGIGGCDPISVRIFDGGRHVGSSGYGELARSLIRALAARPSLRIMVSRPSAPFQAGIRYAEEIERLYAENGADDFDIELHVSPPPFPGPRTRPAVFYTQNALGGLIADWAVSLRHADSVVVPGEFDLAVFEKHHPHVYTCHQHVDEETFAPRRRFRNEGPDATSFLFVGSYSYRKGVDILLREFAKTFRPWQRAHLHLHCFSGLEGSNVSHLLDRVRDFPRNVTVSAFAGSVSPEWMARIIARYDVVVSFSRGEGWCMPLHEGLLCRKYVVCPDSTAMGEMLPEDGVFKVPVTTGRIDEISDPFGESMRRKYGEPGNFMWEVEPEAARAALRQAHAAVRRSPMASEAGRRFIVESYSLESMGERIESIIRHTLRRAERSGPPFILGRLRGRGVYR